MASEPPSPSGQGPLPRSVSDTWILIKVGFTQLRMVASPLRLVVQVVQESRKIPYRILVLFEVLPLVANGCAIIGRKANVLCNL